MGRSLSLTVDVLSLLGDGDLTRSAKHINAFTAHLFSSLSFLLIPCRDQARVASELLRGSEGPVHPSGEVGRQCRHQLGGQALVSAALPSGPPCCASVFGASMLTAPSTTVIYFVWGWWVGCGVGCLPSLF